MPFLYLFYTNYLVILLSALMGLQGGKGSRVVNSVLALKSYGDKQAGKNGFPKYGGNVKSGKCFVRRNSELFTNSLSRSQSFQDGASAEQNFTIDFLLESIEMVGKLNA